MKAFACGDVVPQCRASWVEERDDDILVQVARHAAAAHGLSDLSPELVTSVRAHIRDVS